VRRLTFDEIAAVACGCETVRQTEGAVQFHRLPDALAAHYRHDAGSRIRLECTSGVRLRFATTTRRIRIGLRYGDAARPFYRGELTVDGRAAGVFGPDEPAEASEDALSILADERPARVEVWLPHLVRTDLLFLDVDEGADVTPSAPRGRRWLALGDSITQGMTAPLPTQTWVAQTATALGLDVRNYGIGGGKLEDFLADAELGWPYDLLTIAYGANDFNVGRPPEQVGANAARLLARQAAAHPGAMLVLITPLPWAGRSEPNPIACSLQDYREALTDASDARPSCFLIDGTSLVPDDTRYFVDNVHPNAEGMMLFARNFAAALRSILA